MLQLAIRDCPAVAPPARHAALCIVFCVIAQVNMGILTKVNCKPWQTSIILSVGSRYTPYSSANADELFVHAAAMDPRYQRLLASKLQEHAHNYTLTDVSFR